MKRLRVILVLIILALAVAAPLIVHQRTAMELQGKERALRFRAGTLARFSYENNRLSNLVSRAKNEQSLDDTELNELLRLRNHVAQLRRAVKEIDQLRQELERMQDAAEKLRTNRDNIEIKPTALLAEEMPLRQARVRRLKQWLEKRPEENIPELQFLPETAWIKQENWEPVTDEDFRGHMSALRSNAEGLFGRVLFEAVKNYGEANNGHFPGDLAQLKPFFEKPVENAILERYEIVPAKTLPKFLAETGGDWLITQKAPVNKKYDSRMAIGSKDRRSTLGDGRWDPVR